MHAPKAVIIGGSMGGLFAGNLLHRAGWDVTLLEKAASPLTSRGTGIVTHPGLREVMRLAGAHFENRLGIEISRRLAFDAQGHILSEVQLPQNFTSWSRLLNILLEAFPSDRYHLSSGAVRIEDGDSQQAAKVHLHDGRILEADLVVAADGNRSEARRQIFKAPPMSYAGYVGWRGLVHRDALSAMALDWVGQNFGFSQIPGEQIVGYPVLGADHQNTVHINIVWYRRTSPEALRDILTDAQGRHHPEGIPPQLLRPEVVQQARDAAHAHLHPVWAEIVDKAPELIVQTILDGVTDTMGSQRVALLGDAAFVARPHVGQGVTKAAGDALALVQALAASDNQVPAALAAYSQMRVPIGYKAVTMAKQMGAVINLPAPDMAQWAMHFADPYNLITETAVEIDGVSHTNLV
jgi:2-polyprenyl-6-methoxyphenol hydroxylase-like FAD-dependent oxidoreductase